jgi:hypothetical protein
MFLNLNDNLYMFDTKNYYNISFTKFKIGNISYRINNKKFKDFFEYSLLLKGYSNKYSTHQISKLLVEYIDLIIYDENGLYYATIINYLLNLFIDDLTKFNIIREHLKNYIKKIKIRNENFLYTYFFLHYFRITVRNNILKDDTYYYTLKDIIFDFYS